MGFVKLILFKQNSEAYLTLKDFCRIYYKAMGLNILIFLNNLLGLYLLFCEPLTRNGEKPFLNSLQMTFCSRFFLEKNCKFLITLKYFKVNRKGQRKLLRQGQKVSPQELSEWL